MSSGDIYTESVHSEFGSKDHAADVDDKIHDVRQNLVGPRFPIEVWRMVFEAARTRSQREVTHLALLCCALRFEAEDVLYRNALLSSFRMAQDFSSVVSNCTRRARAVRSISFTVWKDLWLLGDLYCYELDPSGTRWSRLHTELSKMGEFLEKLPLLTSIELVNSAAFSYVIDLLQDRAVFLRRLRGEPVELDHAARFLQGQPELEEL